ncbi:MAG: hypothetical protein AAGA80_15345 [Cyanobacteria bacterium P01_F01_bin.143]
MKERFKLAANVLLKRRLNKLVRIDNNVEIDLDFITCAEYQLFIDDMRQEGKNRQPDHWILERFPFGNAKKPITGVRAGDAEEFCQWLTQKESVSGFRYRLPSLSETQHILATTEHTRIGDIGCWCKDKKTWSISRITSQKWKNWQKKLSQYLITRNDFVLEHDFNIVFYQDLNRILNRNLCKVTNCILNLDLYRDLYRILNFDLYRDLYRIINRNLQLDLNNNFHLDFNIDLHYDFKRIFYYDELLCSDNIPITFYPDRDRERYLNLYRDLYSDLQKKLDAGKASNFLRMYCFLKFIVTMCQFLKTIYEEILNENKSQAIIHLNSQECKNISYKYAQKLENIYPFYVYLVLIHERQKGNMPSWEGIRIVREREGID